MTQHSTFSNIVISYFTTLHLFLIDITSLLISYPHVFPFKSTFNISDNKWMSVSHTFHFIQTYFLYDKDKISGVPLEHRQGKHKKKVISERAKNFVRNHINSFPRLPSHYCRNNINKEYLEGCLNISKMYRMYLEKCDEVGEEPVKQHLYTQIFNYDFNLAFQQPKKDLCDLCQEYEAAQKVEVDEGLLNKYKEHICEKNATREERNKDRDNNDVVVCFDLENVVTLPKANVSSFYYKRKLSLFNLAAHCSMNKQGYCAKWTENMASRGGNEISSALFATLKRIIHDNPEIKRMTWSDSCVSQNKNSFMSMALCKFMKENNLETVEQKFCLPGHSSIQEVDSNHSTIEKAIRPVDIYSPVSLVKLQLRTELSQKPLRVIQMNKHKFHDFQSSAKQLNFSEIPYTKVRQIIYHQTYKVEYRNHWNDELTTVDCLKLPTRRRRGKAEIPKRSQRTEMSRKALAVRPLNPNPKLDKMKIRDLKSMIKFMPKTDKVYMQNVCGKGKD